MTRLDFDPDLERLERRCAPALPPTSPASAKPRTPIDRSRVEPVCRVSGFSRAGR